MQQQKQRTLAGMYKLRDWVREENLDFHKLSMNTHPAAMHLIAEEPKRAWWTWLSANPAAMEILLWHTDKIDWSGLSRNPAPEAIQLLREHRSLIDWREFSKNRSPEAVDMMIKNIRKVSWDNLFENPAATNPILYSQEIVLHELANLAANPEMTHVVREHMSEFLASCENDEDAETLFWYNLSCNPAAIDILEKYPEKIEWYELSQLPEAMHMIEKKLRFGFRNFLINGLSQNPAAIDKLERLYKRGVVDWSNLSTNPAIFEYDYAAMRAEKEDLHMEMMAVFWQPENVVVMMECDDDYTTVLNL